MSVSTWLYVSTSQLSIAEGEAELEFIVAASRRRNHDLDVTGALLFTGTCFAQCIEGPAFGVQTLQHDIAHDSRHRDVITLIEESGANRRFTGWSLAYSGSSQLVARIVEEAIGDARTHPPRAANSLLRLLSNFSPLS